MDSKFKRILMFVASIIICQLAGGIGALFNIGKIGGWYATLVRPSFAPPNWVFGPVWTALFLLMGISLFLVWDSGTKKKNVKAALVVFVVQFILNILWSALFFGLQMPWLAFVEIMLLAAAIVTMIFMFHRVKPIAAYLQVPYLLWVLFASALNLAFAVLN